MKVWDRVKFRSITTAGAPLLQLKQSPILKEAEKEEKPLRINYFKEHLNLKNKNIPSQVKPSQGNELLPMEYTF